MTANHTPALGLMSPVDSDTFTSSDFASTFAILDSTPGVMPVNNFAAVQALNWGTAQHGRQVLQLDSGAQWYWYNPPGSTGVWRRNGHLGVLVRVGQHTDVSSSATTGNGSLFLQSGNVTLLGGRAVSIQLLLGLDSSIGLGGMVIVTLTDNGTVLKTANFRPGPFFHTTGNNDMLEWVIQDPEPNSVHNFGAYIRAQAGAFALFGGGTASSRYSVLTVMEL